MQKQPEPQWPTDRIKPEKAESLNPKPETPYPSRTLIATLVEASRRNPKRARTVPRSLGPSMHLGLNSRSPREDPGLRDRAERKEAGDLLQTSELRRVWGLWLRAPPLSQEQSLEPKFLEVSEGPGRSSRGR